MAPQGAPGDPRADPDTGGLDGKTKVLQVSFGEHKGFRIQLCKEVTRPYKQVEAAEEPVQHGIDRPDPETDSAGGRLGGGGHETHRETCQADQVLDGTTEGLAEPGGHCGTRRRSVF